MKKNCEYDTANCNLNVLIYIYIYIFLIFITLLTVQQRIKNAALWRRKRYVPRRQVSESYADMKVPIAVTPGLLHFAIFCEVFEKKYG